MAAKHSGSKIVAIVGGITVLAVGVGTIYLPFIADKDRLRGLHEESDVTGSQRREFEQVMNEMQQRQAEHRNQNNQ
jgi:flagellar basal body-associated protein FliL